MNLCRVLFWVLLISTAGYQTASAQNSAPVHPHPAAIAVTQAPAPAPPAASATNGAPVGSSKPLTLTPLAPLATQIGQTLQTLVGAPSAAPASPVPVTPVTAPAPLTAPTAEAAEDTGQPDTFASDILDSLNQAFAALKADSAIFAGNLASLPDFIDWLKNQRSDPRRQVLWSAIGNDLLIVVGAPLLGAVALSLLLTPLRARLLTRRPEGRNNRFGMLACLLMLRLVPLLVFLGASFLLLDQNESHNLPRFITLNVIYGLAAGYVIRQLLRFVFAPHAEHLRLFNVKTPQARYACLWLTWFSAVIVFGYFFVTIADALRPPAKAIIIFENIFGLILTAMAVIVVVQTRVRVALILRGAKSDDKSGSLRATRQWLARHWHQFAVAYLVISLAVAVLGINNGMVLMLRNTILTFVTLVLSRLCFIALDRWTAPHVGNSSLMHRQALAFLLRPCIWIVAAITIASLWGFHVNRFITTASGQRVTNAFLTVVLTLLVLTVIYELMNRAIDRYLGRTDDGKVQMPSARARTLLPMLRNTIFILFCGIAILTLLASVGLNLGPVLAGAGVVGVAIGFGSQSLVKDFLTGLFIVAENSVAVGDVVTIGTFGGVVEALSIRTIRLRDQDGSLHILPFSEVGKLTNMTRDFAYAVVDVNVAYDSNMDHVMQVLRDIGAGIQNDPLFKRVIEEPIEVLGIEKLDDSAITIRSRMRTRPGKHWDVKRLLLLRIVQRFATENITIPYPTVTHITAGPPV